MELLYRTQFFFEWYCFTTRRVEVQDIKLLIRRSTKIIRLLSGRKNSLLHCCTQSGGETNNEVGLHRTLTSVVSYNCKVQCFGTGMCVF